MDKRHFIFSKNKTKLVTGVLSRALNSPFRSSGVRRAFNSTGLSGLSSRNMQKSQLRARISPAFYSDQQPFQKDSSFKLTSEEKESSRSSGLTELYRNIIKTPSTVQECEPLNDDSLDESLFSYFHCEYSPLPAKTPAPSMVIPSFVAPSIRHRYQTSLPGDIGPFRSETPKIPTRDKAKEVKLPAVEAKPRKDYSRSPSPQEKRGKYPNHYFGKIKPLARPKNRVF
jgi:hypothetical protein